MKEGVDNVNVEVIEGGNSCEMNVGVGVGETGDPNATEYSSSFEGTVEDFGAMSEGEVESHLLGGSAFDAFDRVFPSKKRRLTTHWRNYIRPIMWRCKWMELRMKEVDLQVLKYCRELEAYEQGKPPPPPPPPPPFDEAEYSKSLPFSSGFKRRKAMKRRKRKRVEDASDVAWHMTQHNFFSYLENNDTTAWADEFGNPVTSEPNGDSNGADDWTSLDPRPGDVSVEHLLDNIETLHCRVRKLKEQIDSVMSTNPAMFCSNAFSAGNAIQHLMEYDISSFVPDMIESTVGFVDSNEEIVENEEEQGEGERQTSEHSVGVPKQEAQQVWGVVEDVKPCLIIIPSSSSSDQSALKPCLGSDLNFPRNKRKRGDRKPGAQLMWNNNHPDTDIQ